MNSSTTSLLSALTAIALAMVARGAFAAVPRHLSNMPESPYLDTEASTNRGCRAASWLPPPACRAVGSAGLK